MWQIMAMTVLFTAVAAHGDTVYKTVGEDGVVSYSDVPPDDAAQAEVMEFTAPEPVSAEEYQKRMEAMTASTDRMAADRREREAHRAQMKSMQQQQVAYSEPAESAGSVIYSGSYMGSYYPRRPWRHPPWRPGHRPKPEHPIAGPPLRGEHGGYGKQNAQLMRPMASGKSRASQR